MLVILSVGASAFQCIARPRCNVARAAATMTAEADRVEALRAQLDTSMRVEQQVNTLLSRLEAASSRLNTYVLPAEPAADETGATAAAGRTASEAKVAALEAKVAALEVTQATQAAGEPAPAAVQAAAEAKAEVAVAASRAGEAVTAAKAELVEAAAVAKAEMAAEVAVQGADGSMANEAVGAAAEAANAAAEGVGAVIESAAAAAAGFVLPDLSGLSDDVVDACAPGSSTTSPSFALEPNPFTARARARARSLSPLSHPPLALLGFP